MRRHLPHRQEPPEYQSLCSGAKKLVIFARRALNPLGQWQCRHANLLEYVRLREEQFVWSERMPRRRFYVEGSSRGDNNSQSTPPDPPRRDFLVNTGSAAAATVLSA